MCLLFVDVLFCGYVCVDDGVDVVVVDCIEVLFGFG